MGMFNWVKIENKKFPSDLPKEGWQTYDVVDCLMETLIVKDDSLVYSFYNSSDVNLDFTGDMFVCNFVKNKFVEYRLGFENGILVDVEKL